MMENKSIKTKVEEFIINHLDPGGSGLLPEA
jgi:hypothetical protein